MLQLQEEAEAGEGDVVAPAEKTKKLMKRLTTRLAKRAEQGVLRMAEREAVDVREHARGEQRDLMMKRMIMPVEELVAAEAQGDSIDVEEVWYLTETRYVEFEKEEVGRC